MLFCRFPLPPLNPLRVRMFAFITTRLSTREVPCTSTKSRQPACSTKSLSMLVLTDSESRVHFFLLQMSPTTCTRQVLGYIPSNLSMWPICRRDDHSKNIFEILFLCSTHIVLSHILLLFKLMAWSTSYSVLVSDCCLPTIVIFMLWGEIGWHD